MADELACRWAWRATGRFGRVVCGAANLRDLSPFVAGALTGSKTEDKEPEPVKGRATADEHLPARRIVEQLAACVGVELDACSLTVNRHGWVLCTDGRGPPPR